MHFFTPEQIAKINARRLAIQNSMPSWSEVDAALDGIENDINALNIPADSKAVLRKILNAVRKTDRIVYWLAKDSDK